jgi:hypothetical protein
MIAENRSTESLLYIYSKGYKSMLMNRSLVSFHRSRTGSVAVESLQFFAGFDFLVEWMVMAIFFTGTISTARGSSKKGKSDLEPSFFIAAVSSTDSSARQMS